LRGYGKVAPATADYLDAELAELETTLEKIIRTLREGEPNQNCRDD